MLALHCYGAWLVQTERTAVMKFKTYAQEARGKQRRRNKNQGRKQARLEAERIDAEKTLEFVARSVFTQIH